ncbi:RluA family pseudouridine synthase [Agathobacter sp.]
MGKHNIIYEDNDIIVCYKPAGMATQTRRIGQQDMESFIRNYRAAKNEPPYVGIVHRLDQPIEGVMVFAKNQKAAASLSRQIKEHTTEKYYYAASYGTGCGNEDDIVNANETVGGTKNQNLKVHTLTDYISFDKRTNISKITTAKDPQAKKAVLEYEIVEKKNNITIFDIKLFTGRHHQIRLQFSNIGYPLIGDTKYGVIDRGRGTAREQLALCSYKIVIDHPASGKRMAFEVEPQNPVLSR